jgi:hypothetical protein
LTPHYSESTIFNFLLIPCLPTEVDNKYGKTNAPTFCLPKPGQPDQWRVLADMKKGHQNEAMVADPTVFPQTLHILSQMHHGGYMVVIDASKYFYNFPAIPDE